MFALGQLTIAGYVTQDVDGLDSFTATSRGTVFSSGVFADAKLGDVNPNDDITLRPGGTRDFAYQAGPDLTKRGSEYIFDPIGGGLQPYIGKAEFDLNCPPLVQFTINHTFGAEIGLLASAGGYPMAGASLRDLELCVTLCDNGVPTPDFLPPFTELPLVFGVISLCWLGKRRDTQRNGCRGSS